jgi:hypothetical protein
MAFEGIFGTGACFFPFDDAEPFVDAVGLGEALCCSDTSRLTASGLAAGRGGGNGDTETQVIEAECAW